MKYWKLIALAHLLISISVKAKNFSLAPGVSISSATQSDQLTEDGKQIFEADLGLGFNLDAEIKIYKKLSLLINGQWIGGEGISQYDYTDKKNPLEQAAVADMKSNYSMISAGLGARFRFLEVENIVAFMGYLYSKGQMIISHDENKFLYTHYSKLGWKEKEEQGFGKSSFELGIELFPAKSGKLHIIGRQNKFETDSFETLNNKKLSFKNFQLLILYRHLF